MNSKSKLSVLFLLILFLFLGTNFAYADAGVPMIFVTFPWMIIGLIPIILIEGYVLNRRMKWGLKRSMKASAIANIVSTVVGIPLTWGLLVLIEMVTGGGRGYGINSPLQKFMAVTWQGPWLIPYGNDLYWMVPTASMFLCIPFFFTSWFIETLVAMKMLRDIKSTEVKDGFYWSNIASYLFLFSFCLIWLVYAFWVHS